MVSLAASLTLGCRGLWIAPPAAAAVATLALSRVMGRRRRRKIDLPRKINTVTTTTPGERRTRRTKKIRKTKRIRMAKRKRRRKRTAAPPATNTPKTIPKILHMTHTESRTVRRRKTRSTRRGVAAEAVGGRSGTRSMSAVLRAGTVDMAVLPVGMEDMAVLRAGTMAGMVGAMGEVMRVDIIIIRVEPMGMPRIIMEVIIDMDTMGGGRGVGVGRGGGSMKEVITSQRWLVRGRGGYHFV